MTTQMIVNALTNEVEILPLPKKEVDERAAEEKALIAKNTAEAEAKAAAKAALIERLGITAEEAKLLLL
jgi:hypothetical protein